MNFFTIQFEKKNKGVNMDYLTGWRFEVFNKRTGETNIEASSVLNGLVDRFEADVTKYVVDVMGLEDGSGVPDFYKWIESEIFIKVLDDVKIASGEDIEIKLFAKLLDEDSDVETEVEVTEPLVEPFSAMEILDDGHMMRIETANHPIFSFLEDKRLPSDTLKNFIEKL